jgi:cellulose synthase/poly-beta-1,6-N-acetylglucosamine synthase-like glycosyltransferase
MYLVVTVSYLVVVTVAACSFRKRTAEAGEDVRIAVIMPAHNEALQIKASVAAVLGVEYPVDRFSAFVIADNCDDNTAELARQAGATVFERRVPDKPGKGPALDWCLRRHREMLAAYDAIVIVDADTTVAPGFLLEVAASLSVPGTDLVQTADGVANPEQNWRTALTYAGFALMNDVRARGRTRLGGSAGFKGNGMAFRSGLLLDYGWPAYSVVEDVEFSIRLLLDGHIIAYNPDAVLVSEMPAARRQADVQRRRWEGGRFQLWRHAIPVLAHAAWRQLRWRYLDAMLDLLVPPLSLLVMTEGLLLALAVLSRPVWAVIAAYCLAGTAFHVGLGLRVSRAPARVWWALAAAPFFVLWKIPIYARILLGRKETAWRRTTRQAELERDGDDGGDPADERDSTSSKA